MKAVPVTPVSTSEQESAYSALLNFGTLVEEEIAKEKSAIAAEKVAERARTTAHAVVVAEEIVTLALLTIRNLSGTLDDVVQETLLVAQNAAVKTLRVAKESAEETLMLAKVVAQELVEAEEAAAKTRRVAREKAEEALRLAKVLAQETLLEAEEAAAITLRVAKEKAEETLRLAKVVAQELLDENGRDRAKN